MGWRGREEGPTSQAGDLGVYPGRKGATDTHAMPEGATGMEGRSQGTRVVVQGDE